MATINQAASWIMAYPGYQDPKCNECGEKENDCDCCTICGAPPSEECDCIEREEWTEDERIEDGVRTS